MDKIFEVNEKVKIKTGFHEGKTGYVNKIKLFVLGGIPQYYIYYIELDNGVEIDLTERYLEKIEVDLNKNIIYINI